ncbi:secreted RxLR effector protein 161-like [Helianthus annuus]|uniref:secreted RxLR effector protein 161-like n=1 Tax=Helianthus annuus TaxID=4232 RepID=UPI0016530449|nr:secreted RxLR effector protein 161-like [Helianthus annuus]
MSTCFKMGNSKKGGVPMTKGTVLNKLQSPSTDIEIMQMEVVPYASHSPGITHWTEVKNILRYLRRTKDMFLVFGGVEEELTIRCYTDAGFQSDQDDSHSQIGFVFTPNGGAVYWKSSKQSVVADSATESEGIAASDAAKEFAWMK